MSTSFYKPASSILPLALPPPTMTASGRWQPYAHCDLTVLPQILEGSCLIASVFQMSTTSPISCGQRAALAHLCHRGWEHRQANTYLGNFHQDPSCSSQSRPLSSSKLLVSCPHGSVCHSDLSPTQGHCCFPPWTLWYLPIACGARTFLVTLPSLHRHRPPCHCSLPSLLPSQDASVLSLIPSLGPSLRVLDLSSCVALTNQTLQAICTYLTHLSVLRLAWCKGIQDWGLLGLGEPNEDPAQESQVQDPQGHGRWGGPWDQLSSCPS